MTQGERVKEIRKALGLTLEQFGEKLGVQKSAISKIEKDRVALSDQMAKSICREYNVNYDYLVYGDGEMYASDETQYFAMIDRILKSENQFAKNVFKTFATFDVTDWEALQRMIEKYQAVAAQNNETAEHKHCIYDDVPDEPEGGFPEDDFDDISKNAG